VSLNIPLPTVPARARVPAHITAPREDGAETRGGHGAGPHAADAGMRTPGERPRGNVADAPTDRGPSPHCHAPFDAASVPADALPFWDALREVMDPELPISVVDMGLIYDVRLDDGTAEVTLTYTATGCPCVDFIRTDITTRLLAEPGVDAVALHEVWSPPWTRAMMTEEGRAALRGLGVAA
jgi:metal-sulfur cluster biosynthetic enzyme